MFLLENGRVAAKTHHHDGDTPDEYRLISMMLSQKCVSYIIKYRMVGIQYHA